MNAEVIKMLKEAYEKQKPYLKEPSIRSAKEKEILERIEQNSQRCYEYIWKRLIDLYLTNPVCEVNQYYSFIFKIFPPYWEYKRKIDDGDYLEKLNSEGKYDKIYLYCEEIDGEQQFFPIFPKQVSILVSLSNNVLFPF